MEIIFVIMIMYSFGFLGVGIGDYVEKKTIGKKPIIDRDKPKEFWERDIEDWRYYSKNQSGGGIGQTHAWLGSIVK